MKKCTIVLLILALLSTGLLFAQAQQEAEEGWKPTKTITLIVPWGAGGASDQTGRMLASLMEPILGARIAVVNQPGASGATGQKSAYDAPKDGYTWAANADSSVATYQVLGLTPEISHRDWRAYLGIYTPCVICVNPNSPITDWNSLVNAFKTREVAVASAGIGAGGHIAAETFASQIGVKYKHVPYAGGNPAVVATVSGETEVVMQLSMEVADMLRAGRIRAIAVMDNKPLTISNFGTIPAITDFAPGFPTVGFYFGLFIPRSIPDNVEKAIAAAFEQAAQSQQMKDFADLKGSVAVAIHGEEADKIMDHAAALSGWLMYDAGVTQVNPETLGIPRP